MNPDRSRDSLEGQVILVTGAGQGLGAAIAALLARSGANVIAADLRPESAKAVASAIGDEGGQAEAMELDVGDEELSRNAIATIEARHGRLDALINNAGVDYTVPINELTVAQWDRVIRTNLRGPFLLSKHAVTMMRKQGSGHIVNVASTAAKRAWPNASAYHASKWALLGLSHALHAELRPYGIKVSAVVAGGMRTPFLLDRFPDLDPKVLQDPANVASTVRFLLMQPPETVIPEVTVLPIRETSWP
jgi:NAD(P)-dependent dehydrogenase (short-subunit alcohol dehydrogenase family)